MPGIEEQIPGYREALQRERELRELAFLGAVAPIAGVPVAPLTIARLNLLMLAGNAFVVGGQQTAGAIAQFLWIVSTAYEAGNLVKRDKFIRSILKVDVTEALEGIETYLHDAFFDVEGGGKASKEPIASWQAMTVDIIAGEYGWSRAEILNTPIAELMQYRRCIEKRHGAVVLNPMSNGIVSAWLEKQNAPKAEDRGQKTEGRN